MKIFRSLFFLFLVTGLAVSSPAQTTIWLVRHAEKDVSNPQNNDPDLSEAGRKRSLALARFFVTQSPAVLFSTPFKRTRQTASPLSMQTHAPLLSYDPARPLALRDTVFAGFKDKSVLIVGHSNTVLELIEVFGGRRPIPALSDDDYDYLFKLTISASGKVLTEAFQYGDSHRAVPGSSNKMH